jgi:hypothetical protein
MSRRGPHVAEVLMAGSRLMISRYLAASALLLAAACGSDSATVEAPKPSITPRPSPTPPAASAVHFNTPQAAMRYLASAWNRNDLVQLKHVTDPLARDALQLMHDEAANLTFDHCTFTKARGDYECFFTHGFPKGYKSKGPVGTAEFTVGPATKPGWYMTYFIECGG